ncbi:MAG TPA: hypothetical protein VM370_02130 [Candidatus Thermoplasmatota archaeon]|nr:hypothetical protein [Candidatus Thermoplasmatota archaeon]
MRAIPLAAALALAALSAPTAAAAPASLSLELPEGPIDADVTVPVVVRLTASDFMCHEDRAFVVTLATATTDGVKALFESSTVTFPVQARSYYINGYEGEATVNLSVRAIQDGNVELSAHFEADVGPCYVPGGFDPASVVVARAVVAHPATPDTSSPTPPSPSPGPQETPPSATPAATPTPASTTGGNVCGPRGDCGAIGEFQAPAESSAGEQENDTPGVGVAALVLSSFGLALLMRRRVNV